MTVFRSSLSGKIRSGWRFVLLLFLIGVGLGAVIFIWEFFQLPQQMSGGVVNHLSILAFSCVAFSVVLFSIWVMVKYTERRELFTVGLRHPNALKLILCGGGFGVAVPIMYFCLVMILGNATTHVNVISMASVVMKFIPLILMFVMLAGVEELILRGYGLQLLIEGLGKWWAIVSTGILFGLAHADNPGSNLIGMVNTAINGMLLAMIVIKTGSIFFVWSYHALWNIMSQLVFGFMVSGRDLGVSLFNTTLTGSDWITGGTYGFEGSAIVGFSEVIILFGAYRFVRRYSMKTDGNYFQRE